MLKPSQRPIKRIKEALENGIEIPGAHLEVGERSLMVR